MTCRLNDGQPVEYKEPEELDAVQWTLRQSGDAFTLAMAFDPGDAPGGESLMGHAADIMFGLLHLRGWRRDLQEVRVGRAAQCPDRWWDRTVGPSTFVLESDLVFAAGNDPDDLTRLASLTTVAWSMEREMRLRCGRLPVLMTGFAPDGVLLASVRMQVLTDAMRAQRQRILERMDTLPEPMRRPVHAHVLNHLEASTVRPWSLPERSCAFGTATGDPAVDRIFIALQDIAETPETPDTVRALLRRILASGADD